MRKLVWVIVFALVMTLGIFAFSSSAADENSDAVWKVQHADGSIEYYNNYYDAYTKVKSGDYFTMVKDRVELTGSAQCTISDAVFTLDYGDSTVVFTEKTIRDTRVVFKGSKNTINIVANGAKIFMQTDNVGFMNLGNNTMIVNGGEDLLTYHGPCFVDTSSGSVELNDVYMRKNTQNMRGLICSRGNAKISIYNSILSGTNGKYCLLAHSNGTIDVYNTIMFAEDNGQFVDIDGETNKNASVTLHSGTYVYGQFYIRNGGSLKIADGVYTNFDPTPYLIDDCRASASTVKSTETLRSFVEPASEEISTHTVSYTYTTTPPFVIDPVKNATSVFRIIDKNGKTVGYSSDFYQTLLNHQDGQTLRLLRHVDLSDIKPITLKGNLTVDLANYNVFITDETKVNASTNIFTLLGKGTFTLQANSSVISAPKGVGFINTGAGIDINLELGGAYVFTTNGINFAGSTLTVKGGYLNVNTDKAAITSVGDLLLEETAIVNDGKGLVVDAYAGFTSKTSDLASMKGEYAIKSLFSVNLEGGIIYGLIDTKTLSATNGTRFSKASTDVDSDFFFSNELKVYNFVAFSHKGYTVTRREIPLMLDYVARNVSGDVLANFTLENHLSLNVYIPAYVFGNDKDGCGRIVVDGLLYNVDTDDGVKCYVDSGVYYRFVYPFIYHDGLDASGRVDCVYGSHKESVEFNVIDVLVASMEKCKDENVRRAIGAYLMFAFEVKDVEGSEQILEGYSEFEYPLYTGTDNEELSSILRTAVFSVEGYINLLFEKNVTAATVTYGYGGRQLTSSMEDGKLKIMTFRIDAYADMSITYTDEAGEHTFTFNLTDLYGVTALGDTYSSRIFRSYIIFLTSALGAEAGPEYTLQKYPVTENEGIVDGTDTPLVDLPGRNDIYEEPEIINLDVIPEDSDTPVCSLVTEQE